MEYLPVQDVDRIINKGLGAGFIICEYDLEKYKPLSLSKQVEEEGSDTH